MGKESREKVRERVKRFREKHKETVEVSVPVVCRSDEFLALQARVTALEGEVTALREEMRVKVSVTGKGILKESPATLFEKVVAQRMERLRNG